MAVRVCVYVVVLVLFVGFLGCVPLEFCSLLKFLVSFILLLFCRFIGVVCWGFVRGLLAGFVRGLLPFWCAVCCQFCAWFVSVLVRRLLPFCMWFF